MAHEISLVVNAGSFGLAVGFLTGYSVPPMYLICNENGGIGGVSRRYSRHTGPLVMSPSAQLVWVLADYAGVLFGATGQQRTTTELIPPQNPN